MITSDSALAWRKSTRCDSRDCVEVATLAGGVALRDSTRPDGPFLRFSRSDWTGLVGDLRGERL